MFIVAANKGGRAFSSSPARPPPRQPALSWLSTRDFLVVPLGAAVRVPPPSHDVAPLLPTAACVCPAQHVPAPHSCCCFSTLTDLRSFSSKRRGASADKAACKGYQNAAPCWARQIRARPSQPWALCSVFTAAPASRGHITVFRLGPSRADRAFGCKNHTPFNPRIYVSAAFAMHQ